MRRLIEPSVIFQSNHLVAVNKPPGWQSVIPKSYTNRDCCLMTYLQRQGLGGGSDQSFLLPLHRIDQPCTGVILYGRTSRAASRIQSSWNYVEKAYLVLIAWNSLAPLRRQSQHPAIDFSPLEQSMAKPATGSIATESVSSSLWMTLETRLSSDRGRTSNHFHPKNPSQSQRGWSVKAVPTNSSHENTVANRSKHAGARLCQLQWQFLAAVSPFSQPAGEMLSSHPKKFALLQVRTQQGARHLIRASLACYGAPIVGDIRYGWSPDSPLKDQSVALHARSLHLPIERITLQVDQRRFVAPIPPTWEPYFGLNEAIVQSLIF